MFDDDEVSAHRTRTNRRPDPPHSDTAAEVDQVLDDVEQDQ
jgi:hypothetical protein